MGLGQTLLLGFIAGATILLGMPVGRLRRPAVGLRVFLNAVAVGILLFLVWDVLSAAWEPIDSALGAVHAGEGGLGRAAGYGLLFAGGLAVGLLSLVGYERWMASRAAPGAAPAAASPPTTSQTASPMTSPAARTTPADGPARFGPGAMHVDEPLLAARGVTAWSPARRLALLIAVGIGLHNFAEGLAIGQSAARSEVALATLLVIGFALHNATEGFGIVAPLAGDTAAQGRPSWALLLGLAAIGGGPTFVGTVVGHSVTSEPVAVAILTLAAGSILYVVLQLVGVATRSRRTDLLAYGLLAGLVLGFATDAVVSAAGV